ncbi:MAG: hypothetical protein ACI4XE_04955, partial [Acutalibacteraceae bacterium]
MKRTKTTAKIFFTSLVFFLLTFSLAVFTSAEDITVSAPTLKFVSATTQSVKITWETNDEVYCFRLYKLDNKTNKYAEIYKGRNTEMTVEG